MNSFCSRLSRFSIALFAVFSLSLILTPGVVLGQDPMDPMGPVDPPPEEEMGINQPPEILSLDVIPVGTRTYQFSGVVQDEYPDSCVIRFSGLVTAETEVFFDGTFSTIIEIPHAGIIETRAVDNVPLESEPITDYVD